MKSFNAPLSDANTRLYIFWIVFMFFSASTSSILYRRRIDKSPVKERPHTLVFSTVGPFVLMSLMYSVLNVLPPDYLYCFPTIVVLVATFLALTSSIMIRIGLFLWEFQITQKKLAFANNNDSKIAASEARLMNLKAELAKLKDRSKWFRIGGFLGWVAGFLAALVTFRLGNFPFDLPYKRQCLVALKYNFQYWLLPDMIIQVSVSAWLFYRMRSAQDNFYIKQELIQTICIMIIPLLLIVLLSFSSVQLSTPDWDFVTVFFINIPAFLQIIVSYGIPIWRTYCEEFRYSRVRPIATSQSGGGATSSARLSSLDDMKKEFQLVLEDPVGADLFQKFLQREWSVENILFWKASSGFRTTFDSKDPATRAAEAQKLYDEYVSPSAPLCVNLPHEIRTEVTEYLAKTEATQLKADMFQKAEQEIFMLMLKDSFRRFTFREDSGYLQIRATIAARRTSVLTVQSESGGSAVPLVEVK